MVKTPGVFRGRSSEELDFRNEALNALRMEELLKESLGESSLEKTLGPRFLCDFFFFSFHEFL